jgi:hypothetical protein
VSNRNFERHTAQLLNNLAGGANATLAVLTHMEGGLRAQAHTQHALHKSLEQVRACGAACARERAPIRRPAAARLTRCLFIPRLLHQCMGLTFAPRLKRLLSLAYRSVWSNKAWQKASNRGWDGWASCSRRRRDWASK